VPFVEPLVFLSASNITCTLDSAARQSTYIRDTEPHGDRPGRAGIITALTGYGPLPAGEGAQPYPATTTPPRFGDSSSRRAEVDVVVARALSRAMEDAGIRPSKRQQRVADYELVRLLFDGPGYQDWEARHVSLTRLVRRIRRYTVAAKTAEARQMLARAALREFQILQGVKHPGIVRAIDYHEHELGPCLVFRRHRLPPLRWSTTSHVADRAGEPTARRQGPPDRVGIERGRRASVLSDPVQHASRGDEAVSIRSQTFWITWRRSRTS
jgi:hypothetical protein